MRKRRRMILNLVRLTARQSQVVKLVLKGRSNAEIAKRLGITVGTVKIHLHNAYSRQ
jgi:two-component system nitrate/nitrite response regulator NarL